MKTVEQLNQLLRQEFGSNKFGEGIFRWSWSEDLFWPGVQTGRTILKTIEVPIIGGGTEQTQIPVPEYKRVRQTLKLRNQWVVTRWLSPALLAGLHRDFYVGEAEAEYPEEYILERWRRIYPTSEYPTRGVHFRTDYYNPPHVKPALDDTQFLIHQLREQLSGMSAEARLADMIADSDAELERKRQLTETIVEDCFTAFLNAKPGARGGHVSLPDPKIQAKGETKWASILPMSNG